jgi:hypothetical protein
MKITVQFIPSHTTAALWERFNGVAAAQGIDPDEALRQALQAWLLSVGSGIPASTLTVTEKEFAWIRATLDVLREEKSAT